MPTLVIPSSATAIHTCLIHTLLFTHQPAAQLALSEVIGKASSQLVSAAKVSERVSE